MTMTSETPQANSQTPKYRPMIRPNAGIIERKFVKNEVLPANNRDQGLILVRMRCVSICQTDRRILLGDKPSELSKTSLVLGHEGGGICVDPGCCQDIQPGQRVIVLPHVVCGKCPACRKGLTNLCPNLSHIGLHVDGTLGQLRAFPRKCVFPVPYPDFNDRALPLVEPLACSLRAISRIEEKLAELSDLPTADSNPIVIVGGGPMGCLIARALTRLHPSIRVTIVEPLDDRRQVIEDLKIADVVIPRISTGQKNPISFVACSELKASVDAVSTAAPGGSVILFSGINNGELTSDQSRYWEYIHRRELSVREDHPITGTIFLIGSSGYTIAEIEKAVQELYLHYPHYSLIQNRIVHGLNSEVELLLSPRGIHDQKHGSEIARVLKPLIML